MILFLLFSFSLGGGFGWEEVKGCDAKSITRQIKESSVVKDYGKKKLQRKMTRINGNVFKGGDKVLIPKGAEILRIPEGLELNKTEIEMPKYDRYTALYEEGKLKEECERLEGKSAKKLGLSSLEDATAEDMRGIMSGGSRDIGDIEEEIPAYPQKVYFSFILIRVEGREKLLPVVLSISPLWELLNNNIE